MSETLTIMSLGGLEIKRGESVVTGLASRKAEALLVYLACTGRPHPREVLAELLWDDRSQRQAMANLRVLLSSLRQQLAPYLSISRQTVAMNPESDYWIDAVELETSLHRFREQQDSTQPQRPEAADRLRQTLSLYRGSFLQGFHLRDGRGFDDWTMLHREWLQHLVITTLNQLVHYCMEHGAYQAGIEQAMRLLQLDPLQEEGHRQLMLLLARDGQRTAAIAQYENCRTILQQELGVEPTEETNALYEQIRKETIGRTVKQGETQSIFTQLPFVGREEELAWLLQQYETSRWGTRELSLVEGEAGMGKTRLAEEALNQIAATGAPLLRGRCYQFGNDLPYQPIVEVLRDALAVRYEVVDHLSSVWLAELGRLLPELYDLCPHLAPSPKEDQAARQRLFEATARLLEWVSHNGVERWSQPAPAVVIFLDDLQWVDSATADLLHYLLHRLEDVPVWFVGAYRWEETDLDHPLLLLRRTMGREERLALLRLPPLTHEAVRRMVHHIPQFESDKREQLVGYLVQHAEGNPFILLQLLQELEEKGVLYLAESGWQLAPDWKSVGKEDHTSAVPFGVREMVLGRAGHLSPQARQLLFLAATIGRNFSPALIYEVAGGDEEAADALEECIRRNLLVPHASLYDFSHDMIRQSLYDCLSTGERQQLHGTVARTMERLYHEKEEEMAERLAYHYSQSGDETRAVRYLHRAGERAARSFAWDAAIRYFSQALALLSHDDYELQVQLLARRERACNSAALRDRQKADLDRLEALASRLQDERRLADVLARKVEWALRTGNFAFGVSWARQAAELAHKQEQDPVRADALRDGSSCLNQRGQAEQAIRWGQEALELYTRLDDRRGQAMTLGNLGVFALEKGNVAEASRFMTEACALWKHLEDQFHLAAVLNNLSMLHYQAGDYSSALASQLAARELVEELGNPDLNAHSLTSLGIIYHALGHYEKALASYDRAIQLGSEAADKKIECYALLQRGDTLLRLKQRQRAEQDYRRSLEIQEAMDIPIFRTLTLNGVADCRLRKNDLQGALALLREAADVAGDGLEVTLTLQAELYYLIGRTQQAREVARRLAEILDRQPSSEACTVPFLRRAVVVLQRCDLPAQANRLETRRQWLIDEQARKLSNSELRRTFLAEAARPSFLERAAPETSPMERRYAVNGEERYRC